MKIWNSTIVILLLFLLGIPAMLPVVELICQPPTDWTWDDLDRFYDLSKNSILLVAGTIAIALPAGVILALLLFRTDLPGRRFFLILIFLTLFVPLPVLTSAWHAVFGGQSGFPWLLWSPRPGQPWPEGLGPAIWVHAMASIPWVVLLVGHGMLRVERELEDAALLQANQWVVAWKVTFYRCRPFLLLAVLWVAVITVGEISVTDMFVVRTFAEEVYLVFNNTTPGLPKAVALSLPLTVVAWLVIVFVMPLAVRSAPPVENLFQPAHLFSLHRAKIIFVPLVLICVFLLVGVPFVSLFWRTGFQSDAVGWSFDFFFDGMKKSLQLSFTIVLASLLGSALVGLATALLAWITCWCAVTNDTHQIKQIILLCFVAFLWVIPGPVAGMGLQDFTRFISLVPLPMVKEVLWLGPSPLPTWWAYLLRTFPFAVAVIWSVMRTVPREWLESARVDGASNFQQLLRVIFPVTSPAILFAAFVVCILSLNELSASKHVMLPGSLTFTSELFQRMHSGVTQDVSALCLLLFGLLFLIGLDGCGRWYVWRLRNLRR